MYKNILETSGKMYSTMKMNRSQKHRIYTIKMNEVFFYQLMTPNVISKTMVYLYIPMDIT